MQVLTHCEAGHCRRIRMSPAEGFIPAVPVPVAILLGVRTGRSSRVMESEDWVCVGVQ